MKVIRTVNVAVVGATGAVGTMMLRVLEERRFPVGELTALASRRSRGRRVRFGGRSVRVRELTRDAFDGVDLALFSAGAGCSLAFAPEAARRGALVVDNSSAFRLEPGVPLVVPEVNPEAASRHRGIIANPNCSTIIMVVALEPLHRAAGLRRVVVSTYQSVSGAGARAIQQLWRESGRLAGRWRAYAPGRGVEQACEKLRAAGASGGPLPHRIACNVIPQIDVMRPDGYTKEEFKMRAESRKIMGLPSLRLSATCVRVPVYLAHSEAVTAEFARPITPARARAILRRSPGVVVMDEPGEGRYPMPINLGGRDAVGVGRIRQDPDDPRILHFWAVGDNVRKGAATNAVQIAELLVGASA